MIKEGGHEGHEFTVVSYPRGGIPEFQRVVETIAGYWQKIGLKPKIAMSDYATYRESMRAQKVQNMLAGYEKRTNPECSSLLRNMEEEYVSSEKRAVVHDRKMDDWLKKATDALDLAVVAKNLGEAYRYSYDQHFFIPISMINDEIAVTKRVPDWNPGRRRVDMNFIEIIRQR